MAMLSWVLVILKCTHHFASDLVRSSNLEIGYSCYAYCIVDCFLTESKQAFLPKII